ncbi:MULTISPECIES: lysophospholipase L2 [unclassified Brenneria]|uniref:lysophospholipase L2 n=1 Tax=unclassified Brenneria TaxID=2634434 RepID=UPI0015537182|nr:MULTISPECIES: lysophospholipase L2 [unclassified Brenneria]MBJ7223045.1 lysophospholipase L2 [Brenneria sp. L3-3C-1]MEE3644284.1 lysophospholipase L2 [Brenneria sp. L3_3C_1]MEE3652509.1 lysophospholipase L2 [Brenneria sp. HEZEL_4_2_4]NPD02465.1 lysophospholipase L2 [Brenneria sp. hezel4-2-4]
MTSYHDSLLTREAQFSAFATGELLDFWRKREEGEFIGVDNVPIRFVRFTSPQHDKIVVVFSGRIESYVKYGEVAYDLFSNGYDVLMMDHRGQGRSGRLLEDGHRGHVLRFSDYVDDVELLWQQQLAPYAYARRFALAHSMGGAILAQFLARQPDTFDAAALCAPMCGIHLPMPGWLAWRIVDWAERHPSVRDYYAIGTGQWRPLPYMVNMLTHSRERYQRSVRFYADSPDLRVGGPTYHWVREAIIVGKQLLAQAADITTPILLLQAEEDRVVDNRSQDAFCQALARHGHPCAGGGPQVIKGARHEILFEKDKIRAQALALILEHFAHYH